MDFAREHIHWEETDWERVLFTDESRFCLYHCDRRSLVFRRPHERYAQCNFLNTTGFGGGSIMVWDGISLTARTDLEWPARGPDLNPIEKVWDNLNKRLRSSENHPATLNDLGIQLREISEGLDQNILRSPILSMNLRFRDVINARGGNTKY